MAGTIAAYQQGAFATPVEGGALDASVVLGNDNTIRGKHNSHDNDPTIHVQSSALGSRPAAGTAQRVWVTTDGYRAYVDDGANWQEFAYLPVAGGTVTGTAVLSAPIMTRPPVLRSFTQLTATGVATLTGAQVISGTVRILSGAGTLAGIQLPAATAIATAIPGLAAFDVFDLLIQNSGPNNTVSIAAGAGISLDVNMGLNNLIHSTRPSMARFICMGTATATFDVITLESV